MRTCFSLDRKKYGKINSIRLHHHHSFSQLLKKASTNRVMSEWFGRGSLMFRREKKCFPPHQQLPFLLTIHLLTHPVYAPHKLSEFAMSKTFSSKKKTSRVLPLSSFYIFDTTVYYYLNAHICHTRISCLCPTSRPVSPTAYCLRVFVPVRIERAAC